MTDLNKLLRNAAGFTPDVSAEFSAWLGHLPFASFVVAALQPKVIVELGSHRGHSYFAFCKAVSQNGIDARCYAVDTWQGDEHAGHYGDEIYAAVNAHNQEHYARFSTLMRMTFDEAQNYFPDASVELLHIDGLHTYEAVKHDFETWLPKLAPGAVVVFHDTNVRERGFGVWKLWEELSARYPANLNFKHSHGLGVLQLPGATGARQQDWLLADAHAKADLLDYFAALGQGEQQRYELLAAHAALESRAATIHDLQQTLAKMNDDIVDLQQQLTAAQQGRLGAEQQLAATQQAQAHAEQQLAQAQHSLNLIEHSASWRMTRPLRLLAKNLRRLLGGA